MGESVSSAPSLLPALPENVEAELAALHMLADDALWHIARITLTPDEQAELADLNEEAQFRSLSVDEHTRRETLRDAYDRTMVRRAEAASILQSRGYDLSDPMTLLS